MSALPEVREVGKSLVALLLAELLADGDGDTKDAHDPALTRLRERSFLVAGADGVPRLVLA